MIEMRLSLILVWNCNEILIQTPTHVTDIFSVQLRKENAELRFKLEEHKTTVEKLQKVSFVAYKNICLVLLWVSSLIDIVVYFPGH